MGGILRDNGGVIRRGIGPCLVACLFAAVALLQPGVAGAATFGTQGKAAGQFEGPAGVAIDQSSGDVYAPDVYNYRVDEFDSSNSFLRAWGWSVNPNGTTAGLQTCTSSSGCQSGSFGGAGAGEFSGYGATGIAVDNNEPFADLSAGDVYVLDWENFRVQKFDSEGNFLLMFGGGVNETTGGDVCVAGEACGRGAQGTANGQFEWAYQPAGIIAVGPGGQVYVGDKARVEIFEPSGAWVKNISLSGLSAEGKVTSLAVNSSGDIFVKVQGVTGVHELEPSGVEVAVKLDEGSEAVEALTGDSAGDLFVADSGGGFHILKYDASGRHVDTFGTNTATETRGVALSEASHELYVAGYYESRIWTIPEPVSAGPWIEPGSETANPELRGAATFQATVDPEGTDTSYHFEYVTDAQFKSAGFTGAVSTPSTSVGNPSEDFEDHRVEASLPAKTLAPAGIYHWRVAVSDTEGHTTVGAAQSFEEPPAARIEGPWSANVAATSATLAARIDPLSSNTDYRLEWGKSTAYGHVFSGNVGEGVGYVQVGPYHIQELEPHTTYHYRLIATNEMGTIEGEDHTFTTQIAANELALPDGRAWELVSPPNKGAALIEPLEHEDELIQASTDGRAITYNVSDVLGEGAAGHYPSTTTLISRRSPNGWGTLNIATPGYVPAEGAEPNFEGGGPFLFSSDLALAATQQEVNPAQPLSPEATERTPYLRHNLTCLAEPHTCYTPLVTPRNVEPSGTAFGGSGGSTEAEIDITGATPDLSHILLDTSQALTKGAIAGSAPGEQNLYEWSGGQLQLVNVGIDGKPLGAGARFGLRGASHEITRNAISSDGQRIVFSYGTFEEGPVAVFVRDMGAGKTIQIGGREADYQTMSSDGSLIFYRERGELYAVDFLTGTQTDITAEHGSEPSAGVQDAVLGSSEDGSYVYFVATGVLDSGAKGGEYNLYVAHDGSGGWSTTYIATLSPEDEHSWFAPHGSTYEPHCDCHGVDPEHVTSQVSRNGRFVSFMSSRSLTGYDNVDARSGQPDEEVYLYDAEAGRLACVSCNPTGARPLGVFDGAGHLLVDKSGAWAPAAIEEEAGGHWLAGITPGWNQVRNTGAEFYPRQPHYLMNSGRTFFDSPDALVPQATDGLMNVYEYEPGGIGSCSSGSSTFSPASGGCVSLISSGTSKTESAFYDASESGDDVFFITAAKLTLQDYDTAYDLYDARVCTRGEPCPVEQGSPPPCTSSDACKAAPAPQPALFGAPASATFNGRGNAASASPAKAPTPKRCAAGKVRRHGRCVKRRLKRKRRHRARRHTRRRAAGKTNTRSGR